MINKTELLYDGWNVIDETSITIVHAYPEDIILNSVWNSYIWGLDLSGSLQGAGGVGGLLSSTYIRNATPSIQELHFYCYDGNGNVINLIDIDTKEIAAHYEYDSFGRLIEKEGSYADRNFYRFSTKRVSTVFGIYDYGIRWYDPDFARWLTRDPIGEKGGLNLYGFVGNNPVSSIDPFGLMTPDKFIYSTEEDRKKWINNFKKKFDSFIRASARKNCVPYELLAAIIANEQIDYSFAEKLGENLGMGKSLGPAQITAKTARNEGVVLPSINDKELRKMLKNAKSNIDIAGKLVGGYLKKLCKKSKSGKLSGSFSRSIAPNCDSKDYCCARKEKKSCSAIAKLNVPRCLIKAMAAIWNNGFKITDVSNIPNNSKNAYVHSINAGELDGEFK